MAFAVVMLGLLQVLFGLTPCRAIHRHYCYTSILSIEVIDYGATAVADAQALRIGRFAITLD